MNINAILETIRATSSRKDKAQLLESIRGTTEEYLFRRVALMTYDPSYNYFIKDTEFLDELVNANASPLFEDEVKTGFLTLDKALDILDTKIAKRQITGNRARDLIVDTYAKLNVEDKAVLKCIIERDLKCGAAATTINKVWDDLIYIHPYMRAGSFNKKNLSKINFPCFSQTKMDGEYEDIIVIPGKRIEMRSRGGEVNPQHLSEGLEAALTKLIDYPIVLMGEILVYTDNTQTELMAREDGNGYLNSNDVDPDRLLHVFWDVVKYEDFQAGKSTSDYTSRFNLLTNIVKALRKHTKQVEVVESRIVNNIDEIITHFKENVEKGLEGTVVKNKGMAWKNGTSADQVKVKVVFDCDLKIVGFNQGKSAGEYVERVGSIDCETADGKLKVSVGTGLTDALREEIWQNRLTWMKKVVTVKANDICTNDDDDPDVYSLFLPRYVAMREDKKVADDFDRVIEQKDAFVETLKAIED